MALRATKFHENWGALVRESLVAGK